MLKELRIPGLVAGEVVKNDRSGCKRAEFEVTESSEQREMEKGRFGFFLDFLLWIVFLKSSLNFLQYCFCFMFWFFGHKVYGNLSSPTRNQTHTPRIGRQSLNYWTTREVPAGEFKNKHRTGDGVEGLICRRGLK